MHASSHENASGAVNDDIEMVGEYVGRPGLKTTQHGRKSAIGPTA